MAEEEAKVYVSPLPPDVDPTEVENFFSKYGSVVGSRIMRGYGFIEFPDIDTALKVVDSVSGTDFYGEPLRVEIARSRPRNPPPPRDRGGYDRDRDQDRGGGDRFKRTYRAVISNMTQDTSWQDLKDFARSAGVSVNYTNISRRRDGSGVIDFYNHEDLDRAIDKLNNTDFNGSMVTLREDFNRPRGPPPSRYRGGRGGRGRGFYDRRPPPPRDDYRYRPGRRDDYYDDGYRSPPPARRSRRSSRSMSRSRSRSRGRRERTRSRSPGGYYRSPPPPRGGGDDRDRERGYDDRSPPPPSRYRDERSPPPPRYRDDRSPPPSGPPPPPPPPGDDLPPPPPSSSAPDDVSNNRQDGYYDQQPAEE